MIEDTIVESALATLRPSLAADGFELRAEPVSTDNVETHNNVRVVLAAKPDACLDCLIPDELMVQMIDAAIRQRAPGLGTVELVKIGFDSATPH